MVINVQRYCSLSYSVSLDTLKGKRIVKNSNDYKIYNLSILISWLLHPTQVYGCKSTIARLHNCNKNRVFRLNKLYTNNKNFRSFVDKAIENYKISYASH